MRHLFLLFVCALAASCVATRGDLIGLSDGINKRLHEYEEAADKATTQEDLDEAYEDLLAALDREVEKTVDTIEGRIEDVSETVDLVSEKIGEGPQGWLELLLAAGGTTLAGVAGLHTHRNRTRRRDLEVSELRKAANGS